MKFWEYVLKRVLLFIPILFGTIILIFLMSRLLPGNPVRLMLGPDAPMSQIIQVTNELGLNKPLYIQLEIFFINFFEGKLGMSFLTYRDVSIDIAQYFPASLEEAIFAILIALLIGIPLGLAAGIKQNKTTDNIARVYAISGISFPNFYIAILLILIFGYYLKILPISGQINPFIPPPQKITGMVVIDSLITGDWPAFVSSIRHIILPAFVLSISPTAQIVRLLRAGVIENKNKPYYLTMLSNGMNIEILNRKYLFKVSFIPTLSILGLLFASIISFAYVVETVFAWPGLGRYIANAVLYTDYNAIVGGTIVVVIIFMVVNFAMDLIYKYFDPRIRYD